MPDFDSLAREHRLELLALLEEKARRASQRRIYDLYPDEGPLRRELYSKHLEFFEAGRSFRERCVVAANRVGKTLGMGAFETVLHLTGLYDEIAPWWTGYRFDRPVRAWAAGKTNETTRDIVQMVLCGEVLGSNANKRVSGQGLIPGTLLGDNTWKLGFPNLVDTIRIKHLSGGWSLLGLKSYQQGRGSFEGTAQDVVWLDEEPPLDIYSECLTRTATTNGRLYLTFTPLEGLSETVMQFMPSAIYGQVLKDAGGIQ